MRAVYLSLFCVCLLATQVAAVTVTVTPVTNNPTGQNGIVENQLTEGWSIVTNRYGIGEIRPMVPSRAEAANGMNSKTDGSGVNFGSGTFLARCSYVGTGSGTPELKTPSSIWLGCDQFGSRGLAGISLNQIKTLKYYAYISKVPTNMLSGSSPDNWDSGFGWLFPAQPIMLQFTVGVPNCPEWLTPYYSRLQFSFRPLDGGYDIRGDPKNEVSLNNWLEYTIIENGVAGTAGRWMGSPMNKDDPFNAYTGWSDLLSRAYHIDFGSGMVYDTTLGQCQLLPTTTEYTGNTAVGYKSPGWNGTTAPAGWMNTNGTGKPLNFWLGARMSRVTWPTQGNMAWAGFESVGARSQMDYFTLGIDLDGDGDDTDAGEKFTYNFEPAAGDTLVTDYISQKDLNRQKTDSILVNRGELTKFDRMFKIAGRITDVGGVGGSTMPWMELTDGSGISPTLRIYWGRPYEETSSPYRVNDYVSMTGFLEYPRWPATAGVPTVVIPNVFYTSETNIQTIDPPM